MNEIFLKMLIYSVEMSETKLKLKEDNYENQIFVVTFINLFEFAVCCLQSNCK